MSHDYAFGQPGGKLCISDSGVRPGDYSNIDLTFISRHWPGWYANMPKALWPQAVDHLNHRVSRSPQDLLAHLQRIIAVYRMRDAEAIYGALLDLFIVLDQHGFSLRQRLFGKLARFFSARQSAALRHALLFGINAVEQIPQSAAACLAHGLYADGNVVTQIATHQAIEFSVMDEARDLIDSGFLNEAMSLLEQAVMRQPQDAALNKELLDLYRYTHNSKAFFAARVRFSGLPLALADAWDELAERLGEDERVAG